MASSQYNTGHSTRHSQQEYPNDQETRGWATAVAALCLLHETMPSSLHQE
jgi:hypothetical protein